VNEIVGKIERTNVRRERYVNVDKVIQAVHDVRCPLSIIKQISEQKHLSERDRILLNNNIMHVLAIAEDLLDGVKWT
jgi:hypothetical protein